MTHIASLDVAYKSIEGWHVFTSEEMPGLYVASKDAELAYSDVAESIEAIMRINEGIECRSSPELAYGEFLRRQRQAALPSAASTKKKAPQITKRPTVVSGGRYALVACAA